MTIRMKTTRLLTGVATLAGLTWLLTGCQTTMETGPEVPRTPATPPPVTGATIPDTMAAEASAEAVKHFNIKIVAEGSDNAELLRQSLEGRLAAAGYVISPEAPDILVKLSVNTTLFDREGGGTANGQEYSGYARYQGRVNADITRTWDGRKIGFAPLTVRGKRGLGEEEARQNLTAQLADQAAPFVIEAARPELTGLAVNDVVIHRPWLTRNDLAGQNPWHGRNDPEYVRNFIATTKAQSGVIYCALVAEDYHTGALTFRVVYLADSMPDGLVNRLAAIPNLKIHNLKQ